MNEFIVAEVSKNWAPHMTVDFPPTPSAFLCGQFERVIEVNRNRGHLLHSFQLHRLMVSKDEMNETIIAVFRKAPEGG